MSELKEMRERVRLRARADALEIQLDRRKKKVGPERRGSEAAGG